MQPEALPEVKSRPVYPPVEKNNRSSRHLFVVAGEMPKAMSAIFASCDESERQLIAVNDIAAAQQTITHRVASLPLATTAYVAGDESFIWSVAELFSAEGMLNEQIRLFAPADKSRQLFCCHCYHITAGVTHSPAECEGCRRLLAVTDHFSRKNGAYLGYQVNAEDPADIPETEELS